jgi:hypothetical protein
MMNKRIKKIWLKALRGESPEGVYAQCQGALVHTREDGGRDSFCCLGVLQNEIEGFYGDQCRQTRDGVYGSLDPAFRVQVGLNPETEKELARMNDRTNLTFAEIADWIEEEL